MLNLTSMTVNHIQGTVKVNGKQQPVTVNDNQVSCNANTGTPEAPQWLNVSIDRKTGKASVSMNNYESIAQGATDAQAIQTALMAIVEEVETI